MCGNAPRCAASCAAADHGHTEVTMIMAGVRHQGEVHGGEVAVTAEALPGGRAAVVVEDDGQVDEFDAVHTGTEHAVTLVADADAVDAGSLGRTAVTTPASPRPGRTSASSSPPASACCASGPTSAASKRKPSRAAAARSPPWSPREPASSSARTR